MQTAQNFLKRQSELSAAKQALLEKRLKQLAAQAQSTQQVTLRPQGDTLPLSFAQQRLWFLQQLEPESAAYNEYLATRFQGPLDHDAYNSTAREIFRRHEVLRCRFPLVDGQVMQVIDEEIYKHFVVPVADLRHLPAHEREAEALRQAQREALRPFDLTQDLPWRTQLWQLDDQDYISFTVMHHIVTDEWSFGLFLREVMQLYSAFHRQQPSPLPELTFQYSDYAYRQRQWVESEAAQKQMHYWKERLSGELPVLNLPLDHPHLDEQSYQGQRIKVSLPTTLSQELHALGRQSETTPFMVLLTGLLLLLSRYSQQEDLIVGTPIAARVYPELEKLVGCFVNTLVLRASLAGNPTVKELLQRVREMTLGAYDHQEVPFEKLVELLQPERNLSINPLFQVMFVFNNTPEKVYHFDGLTSTALDINTGTTKMDLLLAMTETELGFQGYIDFSTDLFDVSTIEQMREHLTLILQAMVADPQQHIAQISLLTPAEQQRMLIEWNDTRAVYPGVCAHELFEEQVARTPDKTAVVFNQERLSYKELNERANQLAHRLRSLGVGPEVPVGLSIERSLEMVVGLLGILKAGGAYIPLDPGYPRERLAFMLADSQLPVLLTQQALLDALPEQGKQLLQERAVICLDTDWESIAQESQEKPQTAVVPQNLAYMIYTSGSTGQPKGVQIPHVALVNFLASMRREPGMQEQDTLLAVTTISFDIAALEIFLPLTTGAQLVLLNRESAMDGSVLASAIADANVTMMQATPATWRLLLDNDWQGKPDLKILCGGEALPAALADQLLTKGAGVWNLYGPTETTIWSTLCPLQAGNEQISIGRPIANTQIYILDAHLLPVPAGVSGDLYIGGTGVTRGYYHRSELTAERFIPDPFSQEPGTRMYRTGDLARFLSDGKIEFQGRNDHQVKVRGYRIELDEIETTIRSYPLIRNCVVTVQEDVSGEQRLLAYIVVEQGQTVQSHELYSYMKEHLPEYMVPNLFVYLDVLPLTPNGKLDRRALPDPGQNAEHIEDAYVAPRTPLEEKLCTIWADLLGIKRVGIYQNFFTSGGHSLLITQVLTRVQEQFQVTLPVRTLFKNPTIAGLADSIEKAQTRSSELRKQSLSAVSRDAYRQKQSALGGSGKTASPFTRSNQ